MEGFLPGWKMAGAGTREEEAGKEKVDKEKETPQEDCGKIR